MSCNPERSRRAFATERFTYHIMEKITAKYSEVKNAILEVKSLTADCGIKYSKINLENSYWQDFKIHELDWDFFLEEFEKKFNLNLDGLEYKRFFPEVLDQFFRLRATPKIIFYKGLSFFDKKYKNEVNRLNAKFKEELERLTVGDLVLCVLTKKFVERDKIELVLIK